MKYYFLVTYVNSNGVSEEATYTDTSIIELKKGLDRLGVVWTSIFKMRTL